MPVPKQHASRKRRGDRRQHIFINPLSLVACSHCQAMILPHRVCPECGYYRDRAVIIQNEPLKGKKGEQKKGEAKGPDKEEGGKKADKPLTMEGLSKKNEPS